MARKKAPADAASRNRTVQADAKAGSAAAVEPAAPAKPPLEIVASPGLVGWMAAEGIGLVVTTYQASKLFLLGRRADGRLAVEERTVERCMGVAARGSALAVSSAYQIWQFENTLMPGATHDGYDRIYLPATSNVTGGVDVHDMAFDGAGRLVFVNTRFSCLARLSATHSFEPVWRPSFVSALVPEDRCHLNGLAMVDGRPRYVTCVAATDTAEGWRERRADGGVVIDTDGGRIVLEGLSMPHSPRWHGGALWLLDSGTGCFGRADIAAGKFVPVAFCPGYLRGMAMHAGFAVVGLSKARDQRAFGGLKLDAALAERGLVARCGLAVIDLARGAIAHWLGFEGVVEEIYDVAVLPGCVRPRAIGFKTDEIRRTINLPPAAAAR